MVDSLGTALRQLREDRGWSLATFAAKVRWSKPVIAAVETGRQRPTAEFVLACDVALGSTPILSTLYGLTGEDNEMRRRVLLQGLTAALGVGAVSSFAALSDILRIDMQEAAGMTEDWDAVIGDFRRRLVIEPNAMFGDELLASMLTARHRVAERADVEATRAAAHLGLLYGIWMGYHSNINTGRNHYRTAGLLAQKSRDLDTQVYVLGRTASAGPYQGLTIGETQAKIDEALALASQRPSEGLVEVYAAQVHLAALREDLPAGQAAVAQMWEVAGRLPETTEGPGPAQRAASFDAYLHGRLGSVRDAEVALRQATHVLRHLPEWLAESRLYYSRALVRHGDLDGGVDTALAAARTLRYSNRVIRLGVEDVLQALPPGYETEQVAQLRQQGTTGVKPWELVAA